MIQLAFGEQLEEGRLKALQERSARETHPGHRAEGAILRVDEEDLKQAGWGILFPTNTPPEVKEALKALIERRQEDAQDLCRVFDDYQPGESWEDYSFRHQVGSGLADPREMPYYMLLVGDPETIPFSFQADMSVERAVGRVYFDTPWDYAQYAASVVLAEEGKLLRTRRAAVFSTCNPDDPATELSNRYLADPLHQTLAAELGDGWQTDFVRPEEALKPRLLDLIGGEEAPGMLFTATHGVGLDRTDPRYPLHQGALVTQEWPGPKVRKPLSADVHYLSAEDIGSDMNVGGLIGFFFACFSAGTPRLNDFFHVRNRIPGLRLELGDRALLSALPQRLLAHPRGGALAVVGHVDRAWDASFRMRNEEEEVLGDADPIANVFLALAKGIPLGLAMEEMSARYTQFSTQLTSKIFAYEHQNQPLDEAGKRRLAKLWTANNDARNYLIFGDPAVRLRTGTEAEAGQAREIPVVVDIWSEAGDGDKVGAEDGSSTEVVEMPLTDADGEDLRPPTMEEVIEPAPEPAEIIEAPGENGDAPAPLDETAGFTEKTNGSQTMEPVPVRVDEGLDDSLSFFPPPVPPTEAERFKEEHPELYKAWVDHIRMGYKNNNNIFRRILSAFMLSHYSSVIMNWIVFLVGVAFFVIAGILALIRGEPMAGALFGGLSVISFLTFFISRPTQAVEENLEFITWLGLIYNSYWTHQALSFNNDTAQEELTRSTEAAISQIKELIDRHAQAIRQRSRFGRSN